MHKIAVVNMKGGVAKTTTAIHVAAGFAARGARMQQAQAISGGTTSAAR